MSQDNQIMDKTDLALKAWINSLKGTGLQYTPTSGSATDIPILIGFDDEDPVTLPYIAVMSTQAEERVRDTGNFDVTVLVELHSHAQDSTITEHKGWAEVISSCFWRDDVASGVSALATGPDDYGVMVFTRGPTSRLVEESERITRWELSVFCMNLDLA